MTYDEFDHDELAYLMDVTHDEMVYARKHQSSSIPLGITECEALAALLRELRDIGMHAPGGHAYLLDEAGAWASALSATEPRA